MLLEYQPWKSQLLDEFKGDNLYDVVTYLIDRGKDTTDRVVRRSSIIGYETAAYGS